MPGKRDALVRWFKDANVVVQGLVGIIALAGIIISGVSGVRTFLSNETTYEYRAVPSGGISIEYAFPYEGTEVTPAHVGGDPLEVECAVEPEDGVGVWLRLTNGNWVPAEEAAPAYGETPPESLPAC